MLASLSASMTAQTDDRNDSIAAVLLTCTPGTDAYAHFGHTALCICTRQKATVYNYGCFDYTEGNFVINFMRGNTNYKLDSEDYGWFLMRYREMGTGVSAQFLDLNPEETARLAQLLEINALPENQTYLYNWLYDNCTERARDMIEQAVDGRIDYQKDFTPKTARKMLHDNLANAPWLAFGIDMLLGSEIDKPLDRRVQMFIPSEYMAEASSAVIVDRNGGERKLVREIDFLLEEQLQDDPDFPLSPMSAFTLLFITTLLLTWYEFKNKWTWMWIYDATLHFVQGCVGVIIAGLFFFSIHPAVNSNWYIIIFNPLYIIYAIYLIYCHRTGKVNKIRYVVFAVTLAFAIAPVLTLQSFQLAALPMYLTLLLRTAVNTKLR